ncbi:hypothetical protein Hanom_Chr09g00840651 [Helianthus anomalus]
MNEHEQSSPSFDCVRERSVRLSPTRFIHARPCHAGASLELSFALEIRAC